MFVLRPMTPSQIIFTDSRSLPKIQQAKDPCEKSGERVNHLHVSESQKPNLSEKMMSATSNATKCERSDLSVTHTNTSPSSFSLLLVLQDSSRRMATPRHQDPPQQCQDMDTYKLYNNIDKIFDPGATSILKDDHKFKAMTFSSVYHGDDNDLESRTTLFQGGEMM